MFNTDKEKFHEKKHLLEKNPYYKTAKFYLITARNSYHTDRSGNYHTDKNRKLNKLVAHQSLTVSDLTQLISM